MNSLMFYFAFTISANSDSVCLKRFYESALRDTTSQSPFLKLEVIDETGSQKSILLPNRILYLFMKSKGINYQNYQENMQQYYKGNKFFNYTEYKDLKGYVGLTKDSKVERISRKGANKIIKYYFKNNVFDYQKYYAHFEVVVSKLFDYGVLISMVDNGQFGIVYKSECTVKK